MKRTTSLRTRLLWSHLVVVGAGVIVLLVAASRLAPTFVNRHIDEMATTSGAMMGGTMMGDIRQGAISGLNQALLLSTIVSIAVAIGVAIASSKRLVRPIRQIQATTRKLAAGSFAERVDRPREAELAALADDVNALAAALHETEQRRLRLIAEVSHELRTPLATIKGYMEALVDGVLPADAEALSTVGREAGRLERLALDLQELSRSEEGEPGLRRERCDIADLVREVADRLRPQFRDQDVALEVDGESDIEVYVDPDRMTQVFTNIIGNALTHTPPGGRVSVGATTDGKTVTVTTADTGKGLTPEQLESIFERFFRVDRSTPGGSGIGLTIARSIARRHGGDIVAKSPGLGFGSTFVVTIPSRDSTAPVGER